MENQQNPLRYLDMASQHYLMQVLGWMWSMIFSLSFLSIYHFGLVWLAHLLWIAGVAMTVSIFKEAEKNKLVIRASSGKSSANVGLWNLEVEA